MIDWASGGKAASCCAVIGGCDTGVMSLIVPIARRPIFCPGVAGRERLHELSLGLKMHSWGLSHMGEEAVAKAKRAPSVNHARESVCSPGSTLRHLGPPPQFDRELIGRLANVFEQIPIPLTSELIAESRRRAEAGALTNDVLCREGAFDIEQIIAPGPEGSIGLPFIVCRPRAVSPPYGVLYHIHGGGMISGNNRSQEVACDLTRAAQFGMAVVGVNYRLAPEHPDPAPVEDCYAGLVWIAENAEANGFDTDRIIISGNSAGGGLAAGAALLARDRNGPKLLGQMLQCPMLDDRCNSPSMQQMNATGVWDGRSNMTGWTALLGDRRGTQDVSCYAAPARAVTLTGLPAAFIDVGSAEALRDEAISYAIRIWEDGGEAELHVWSGGFHSFDQWAPSAMISRGAEAARISWLRRILSGLHCRMRSSVQT